MRSPPLPERVQRSLKIALFGAAGSRSADAIGSVTSASVAAMWEPDPAWHPLVGGTGTSTVGVWRTDSEGRPLVVKRLGAPAGSVINGVPLPDFGGGHPDRR